MNIIKLFILILLCLPSFAGIKAIRSDTNPSTSIDSDGKVNLVTTSNTPRTKNYYDTTGFHLLAGVAKEVSSTNYILNSFFSIDANSDGLSDSWTSLLGTETRETCAINNILNGKSQKVSSGVLSGEITRYYSTLSSSTANDSFDASQGNINATLSFFARGDLSGIITGTDTISNAWVSVTLNDNAGTYKSQLFTQRKINQATTDGLHSTEWRKFTFSGTITNTDVRKAAVLFCVFNATDGSRPTTGESFWIEVYGVQIEKQTSATSFIPTTTAALTRNAETYSNLAILFGD
jgi:hypothetical protein